MGEWSGIGPSGGRVVGNHTEQSVLLSYTEQSVLLSRTEPSVLLSHTELSVFFSVVWLLLKLSQL